MDIKKLTGRLLTFTLAALLMTATTLTVNAQILFSEDFQQGIPGTWNVVDVDGNTPNSAVAQFTSAWIGAPDFDNTTDTVAMSTSWYTPAGQSDDWLISPAISVQSNSELRWEAEAQDAAFADGYQVWVTTTGTTVNDFLNNGTQVFSIAAENGGVWAPRSVDLSNFGFTNQTVYVAFRNNSNDKFVLMIDDVEVEEIAAGSANIGITDFESGEYTWYPLEQVRPITYGATINNFSSSQVTNVTLDVNVFETQGFTQVFNGSASQTTLAGNTSTDLTLSSTFTPTDTGTYLVEFISSMDQTDNDLSNDTALWLLVVDDSVMARDDATFPASVNPGSVTSLGFTTAAPNNDVGNTFTLVNQDTLTRVQLFVSDGEIGETVSANVYSFNPSNASATLLGSTVSENIASAADTSRLYDLEMQGGPLILPAGTYLVGGRGASFFGFADNVYTPNTIWGGNPTDGWIKLDTFVTAGGPFLGSFVIWPTFGPQQPQTNQPPVADFSGAPTTVVVGNSVDFTDLSTNNPTSWNWTFNGAATTSSNQQDPQNITYNTVGQYTVELTATNSAGSDTETKTNYITVVDSPQGCDTITNINPTDTLRIYLAGQSEADGYLAGNNLFGDQAKADFFANSVTAEIPAVYMLFGVAVQNNPNATVTVNVWDGASGTPGTVLASETVPLSGIVTDVGNGVFTEVVFANPPTVTGDFFVGVELPTQAGDTVALYTNSIGNNTNTGWEQFSDGTWVPYADTAVSWGVDISNVINPVFCEQTTCPTINVSVQGNDAVCTASNGSATASASGGASPYTYAWSSGGTAATENGLAPGSYDVTVTDDNGCTGTGSVTIGQTFDNISANISTTDATCGQQDGSATANPQGGTPPYTYSWTTGGTNATINNVASGNYDVTVTDANGCTVAATANVSDSGSPNISVDSQGDVNCAGGTDGFISVVATGGTPAYTFDWDNGDSGATITGLTAGSYTVTATDANGCAGTLTIQVDEPASALSVSVSNTDDISCPGSADGAVDISVSGGTPNYSYSWSNGATTQNLSGVGPGTYDVTVTDANGCTATASGTVGQPSNPLTVTVSTTNSDCNNPTGSATANASGGAGGYTYSWSGPGGSTATLSNIGAGTYTVTVTDNAGCTVTASGNVSSVGGPSLTFNTTPVNCFGESNGAVTVNATGGTGSYTYAWSNGGGTDTQTGLSAGSITVTVTDGNNCQAVGTATITQPSEIVVNVSSTDVTCFGGSDGTALANVTGGTGSGTYTYLWLTNPQQSTQSVVGLSAGTVTLQVTDGNGCQVSTQVTIGQPQALSANISSTDVSCNGDNDGTASVTASGGSGSAYSYAWSNGETSSSISGLSANTYSVTITDNNNCTVAATTTVDEPDAIVISTTPTDASCNGAGDGEISTSITGGTPSFTYSWSSGGTSATETGLDAGNYFVTVTDANGCTASASETVGEPTAVTATATGTDVSCAGGNDGSASVSASGGDGSFTYLWSNGQTSASISNLSTGTYSVTVTDGNGCTATASYTVQDGAAINITPNVTDASCNGGNDGSVTLNVTGGASPYTYAWSSGGTGATETGLSADVYNVTVTDDNGCTATSSVTVGQATALNLTFSTVDESTSGAADGEASVSVNGGTSPYTYNWSNGGTSQSITGLSAGTYDVTVTDDNGCTATGSAVVDVSIGIADVDRIMNLELFPNPTSGKVLVRGELTNADDVRIEWFNMLGETVISDNLGTVNVINTSYNLGNQPTGVYFARITYGDKTITQKVIVAE